VVHNQAGREIEFIGRRPGQVAVATAGVVERGGPISESAVAKKGSTTKKFRPRISDDDDDHSLEVGWVRN
jgi:hypothetical protein